MHYACDCAEINQPVQRLPALTAQSPYPALCWGKSEREHQHEPGKSHGDELALGDIGKHFVHVEKFIKPNVGEEVQGAVEKSEQAQHSPELDQRRDSK